MTKKNIVAFAIGTFAVFVAAVPAFAHIIVHPNQVGVAAYQEFTMSVPAEKDNPTSAIKLMIPKGLKSVSPNVKPGWTINEVKSGSGDDAVVTEIDWTNGSIPSGQRDDFLFQAQVPSTATTLDWKAYQTYSDGTVVAWDHDPKLSKGPDDDSAPPPFSTTQVVNDLGSSSPSQEGEAQSQTLMGQLPLGLSVVAIILSLASLGIVLRKRQE